MAILRTLPAAVAVAALTVTLVGCGSSDVRDERDQALMERDEAQAELDQTQTDLDQAQTELEAAQTEAEAAQAELDAAQAEAEAAQAEAERLAMEQAAADEAAAAAEQARMEEEAARMEEEAARMEAEEAQTEAEEALQAAQEAAAAAAAKAASATAKVLLGVLMDSQANRTTPTDPATQVHTPPVPTVSVSTEGMLMAKAPNVRGYTQQADMAPDMIEGWRGATLMNTEGDTAVVYSDIGNDGTQSLLDRYSSNLPTPTAPRSWPVGGAEVTDRPTGSAPIPWSEVTRPDSMTTAGGPSSDPITMFEGSVHGIPGTFSCNADAAALCTAPERYSDDTVNDGTTGLPTLVANAWTFVPDEGVPTYTDDEDYLIFGWWLSKGEDGEPDDLTLITSATELGVIRTETSTLGTALRGKATYKGAAAGKYAIASLSSDMHDGGHFTAMATLMVDFDADLSLETTPAPATNDRSGIALSGTIDNFMTGDMSRPDWMVTLTADGNATATGAQAVANLGAAIANTDAQTPLTTVWSTGGAQKGTGEWMATFYGGDADAAENTTHPLAAIGTFNAHIGTTDSADTGAVGRLQGAFAVNKE